MLYLFYAMIELQHLRNSLPDSVIVERFEERLAAFGDCISCNDDVAFVHPRLDKVTIACISVELFQLKSIHLHTQGLLGLYICKIHVATYKYEIAY